MEKIRKFIFLYFISIFILLSISACDQNRVDVKQQHKIEQFPTIEFQTLLDCIAFESRNTQAFRQKDEVLGDDRKAEVYKCYDGILSKYDNTPPKSIDDHITFYLTKILTGHEEYANILKKYVNDNADKYKTNAMIYYAISINFDKETLNRKKILHELAP